MSDSFGTYSRYYDLLYRDKDYPRETAYLRALINRFDPTAGDILELGCGTGKHASLLADSGLHVTGVERSAEMIAAAQNLHPNVNLVHADARSVRLEREYDAVLSLFHVVSYQTTNDDVASMFDTAATHLRRGGHFIFDLWYGPAVLRQWPQPRVKLMQDDRIAVRRSAEPVVDVNRNLVEVNYEITITDRHSGQIEQFSECHPMRYFFAPEIDLFAQSAGLEVIHSEQWLDGAAPSADTWGVTFVLKKRI